LIYSVYNNPLYSERRKTDTSYKMGVTQIYFPVPNYTSLPFIPRSRIPYAPPIHVYRKSSTLSLIYSLSHTPLKTRPCTRKDGRKEDTTQDTYC